MKNVIKTDEISSIRVELDYFNNISVYIYNLNNDILNIIDENSFSEYTLLIDHENQYISKKMDRILYQAKDALLLSKKIKPEYDIHEIVFNSGNLLGSIQIKLKSYQEEYYNYSKPYVQIQISFEIVKNEIEYLFVLYHEIGHHYFNKSNRYDPIKMSDIFSLKDILICFLHSRLLNFTKSIIEALAFGIVLSLVFLIALILSDNFLKLLILSMMLPIWFDILKESCTKIKWENLKKIPLESRYNDSLDVLSNHYNEYGADKFAFTMIQDLTDMNDFENRIRILKDFRSESYFSHPSSQLRGIFLKTNQPPKIMLLKFEWTNPIAFQVLIYFAQTIKTKIQSQSQQILTIK